jgi:hypothetical protein
MLFKNKTTILLFISLLILLAVYASSRYKTSLHNSAIDLGSSGSMEFDQGGPGVPTAK